MQSFGKELDAMTEEDRAESMQMLRYKNFSIEIDCPPGEPRPGDLFPDVLEGTGLTEDDFVLASQVFGNWTWILKEGEADRDSLFTNAKPIFRARLMALHDAGTVRYASW